MARARIFNPQFKMLLAIIGLVCLARELSLKNIDFQTEAASECFDHQAWAQKWSDFTRTSGRNRITSHMMDLRDGTMRRHPPYGASSKMFRRWILFSDFLIAAFAINWYWTIPLIQAICRKGAVKICFLRLRQGCKFGYTAESPVDGQMCQRNLSRLQQAPACN